MVQMMVQMKNTTRQPSTRIASSTIKRKASQKQEAAKRAKRSKYLKYLNKYFHIKNPNHKFITENDVNLNISNELINKKYIKYKQKYLIAKSQQ